MIFESRTLGDVTFEEQFGQGAFSQVFRARSRQGELAVKAISLTYLPDHVTGLIAAEIDAFNILQHPNIVSVYHMASYARTDMFFIFMEKAQGGDLLDFINTNGRMTETGAAAVFVQILDAVKYCHDVGFVHRDLKLENILVRNPISSQSSVPEIAVADFGFACRYSREQPMLRQWVGSRTYAAPELFLALPYYGPEVDCYALGVILFGVLRGALPFEHSRSELRDGAYAVPRIPRCSVHCQKLLDNMMAYHPKSRPTVTEVRRCGWICARHTMPAQDAPKIRSSPIFPAPVLRGLPEGFPLEILSEKVGKLVFIEKFVGGSYSRVFRANIVAEPSRAFAVKVITPQELAPLNRSYVYEFELKALEALKHPHIVSVFDIVHHESRLCIVMELAFGGDLRKHLNTFGPLDEAHVATLFAQIVEVVQYCHDNGFVHGDLKLDNLLLRERVPDYAPFILLTDFGLARRFSPEHRSLKHSVGSLPYAAPELHLGLEYYGPEVDCFALGVILYALMHTTLPFEGTDLKLRDCIIAGLYPDPTRGSNNCRQLIREMLNVNGSKRPSLPEVRSSNWLGEFQPAMYSTDRTRL